MDEWFDGEGANMQTAIFRLLEGLKVDSK